MSGKGSSRRPCLVSKEEADRNFEAIFGKKKFNQAEHTEAKPKKLPYTLGYPSNSGWVFVKDLEALATKLKQHGVELVELGTVDAESTLDLASLL